MEETWTLSELVAEAAARLEALPAPKNGQIRAVPDERTIRYYATIGLLDRPTAMRGRTALYGRRHLGQVVAIKRMQSAGHSLADIQGLWPTLDDVTLARMTGVQLGAKTKARKEFWKREAEVTISPPYVQPLPAPGLPRPASPGPATLGFVSPAVPTSAAPSTLSISLAPNVSIVVALPDDIAVALSPADVRALRAAAAALVTELANRGLTAHVLGTLEEP